MEKQLTGFLMNKSLLELVLMFISSIIVWYLFKMTKQFISVRVRRNRILNESILSIDSFCRINGVEGIVKEITTKYVKLENEDDDMKRYIFVPLEKVESSIKEKVQYKTKDD